MFDNTVHRHVDPSPSVAPHAPPSAVPTQPHASTSTSTSVTPGPDGKLPTTGVDAGWLLLIALGVGLTGVVLVAGARARRTRS